MKKILYLLLLLLPGIALADKVSPEQAQSIAESFFGASTTRGGSAVELVWDGRGVQTRTETSPAFYVFNNAAGGFVIVAGDESVSPILGYSLTGGFRVEGMPSNIKYWFNHLQEGVDYLRAKGDFIPSQKVRQKWHNLRSGAVTRGDTGVGGGKVLETAQWNQYGPYNLKATTWCSFTPNRTAPQGEIYTGCVATATAIIMRYHKWPERGHGTLDGYSYSDDLYRRRTVRGYELGEAYDWDNMQLSYNEFLYISDASRSGNSQESMDAVALLMRDCGVMVQMQYGTYDTAGSGAYTTDVQTALVEHMDYDRSLEIIDRDYIPHEVWVQRITENIDNCGPVLFDALTENREGHAFVLDGYDDDRNIHINWGWGGYDNGFYTIPDFDDFKVNQSAYLNIKPDAGGSYPDPSLVLDEYESVNGLELTSQPTLSDGKIRFSIKTGIFYNNSNFIFSGDIFISHTDRNDNIKAHILEETVEELEMYYGFIFNNIPIAIAPADISAGDKIKCFYRINGRDEILPVLYNAETVNGEIQLDFASRIEQNTALVFNRETRLLTIESTEVTAWALKDADGNDLSDKIAEGDGCLTLDASALSGTYTLTLSSEIAAKELTLIF